jgi:hypothetical protein
LGVTVQFASVEQAPRQAVPLHCDEQFTVCTVAHWPAPSQPAARVSTLAVHDGARQLVDQPG